MTTLRKRSQESASPASPAGPTKSSDSKVVALAEFLGLAADEMVDITEGYSEDIYDVGNQEYMVLTDSEADDKVAEEIENSLWAFRAAWIADFIGEPDLAPMIESLQTTKYEDANGPILKLIEKMGAGLTRFVEESIKVDGRGHFLSGYDGEENESGEYFIYRLN